MWNVHCETSRHREVASLVALAMTHLLELELTPGVSSHFPSPHAQRAGAGRATVQMQICVDAPRRSQSREVERDCRFVQQAGVPMPKVTGSRPKSVCYS